MNLDDAWRLPPLDAWTEHLGREALLVDLSPSETSAVPFAQRHDHVALSVEIEIGPRPRGELDRQPGGPTDIGRFEGEHDAPSADHAHRRVPTAHRIEGDVALLIEPRSELEAVPTKVVDDGVRFVAGIDPDPEVVERILNRHLFFGAGQDDETAEEQVAHAPTLGGFAENASGQHQRADRCRPSLPERERRRSEGGPSRTDVVDQQHPRRAAKPTRSECACHVLRALVPRELDLARCVTRSPERAEAQWDANGAGNGIRQQRSLVVAPPTPPPPMMRHGSNEVDLPFEAPRALAHQPTEHRAELTPAAVLEALNSVSDRTPVAKDRARRLRMLHDRLTRLTEHAYAALLTPHASPGRHKPNKPLENITHKAISTTAHPRCADTVAVAAPVAAADTGAVAVAAAAAAAVSDRKASSE